MYVYCTGVGCCLLFEGEGEGEEGKGKGKGKVNGISLIYCNLTFWIDKCILIIRRGSWMGCTYCVLGR
ncbi:uncharacterized protein EAE97_005084 [Botrytis byssoidea]|uniref:Uncharacterized protein n=1 Tax=Botrytis byssoidea TaxID=139641 RepID=A0A9P5IRC6_9HELO|nr:uncharacterized protein EAE97_005084 [Botrytis byssoidea]KAF7946046.1 hypothetical protein EAE97_005084 [Botrytis byssoidea]